MKIMYAMLGLALLTGCENKPNPNCPCKTKPSGQQGQQGQQEPADEQKEESGSSRNAAPSK